jgi:hypothetical protein
MARPSIGATPANVSREPNGARSRRPRTRQLPVDQIRWRRGQKRRGHQYRHYAGAEVEPVEQDDRTADPPTYNTSTQPA